MPDRDPDVLRAGALDVGSLAKSLSMQPDRQQYGFNLDMDASMENDDLDNDVGMMHPSVLDLLLASTNVP